MRIIVTGGAGFLGRRLIAALLRQADAGGSAVEEILSIDLTPCDIPDSRVRSLVGDVADPALLATAIRGDIGAIYHLAAVVSGQAEADFDLGMRVNLDGVRAILEAARALAHPPKFIFASSLAVFGGPLPAKVGDSQALLPSSSYGTQKAIGELLVADYSRKGFVDGIALRLPTVSVRPGKPNAAASSFASGIIREPLSGVEAICPVPPETRLWLSSPGAVTDNLVRALALPARVSAGAVNLPGVSVTVAEMLQSLERIGGTSARNLVRLQRDPRIEAIVCSWPGDFDVSQALGLGFSGDRDFDAMVIQYAAEFAPGATRN